MNLPLPYPETNTPKSLNMELNHIKDYVNFMVPFNISNILQLLGFDAFFDRVYYFINA